MPEPHPASHDLSGPVRPAVAERSDHPLDVGLSDVRPIPRNDSSDAAHDHTPNSRGRGCSPGFQSEQDRPYNPPPEPLTQLGASPGPFSRMNLMISAGVFHPHAGGAESLFRDLSRLFVQRGYGVVVITRRLEGAPEEEMLDGVRILRSDYGIPYERFMWTRGLLRFPGVFAKLRRVMRTSHVETVCIGLLDMSVVYLLLLRMGRARRPRLVTYLHGGEVRDLPNESRAFRWLLSATLRASDAVVVVSQALAMEARRYCPDLERKTTVVPNGVDLEAIDAAVPRRRERPYVLYAGRLARDKNAGDVIRAFGRAAPELPGVDLVLAGDGPEAGALRRLVADSSLGDRVEFLGRVDRPDVYANMKGALFTVLASAAEGHPIAVLESLAAGTPVVAAHAPGTSEAVEDGVTGALFPAGDLDAFAHLMRHYGTDEAARQVLVTNLGTWDRAPIDIRSLAGTHLSILAGT